MTERINLGLLQEEMKGWENSMNYLLDDLIEFEKTANAAWRKPASPSTKEEYETERKKLRKNLIRSAVGATAGLALSRIPYGKITYQAKRRDWGKVVKNSTPENFEAIRDKHGIFSRRMNDVATYAPLPGKMIASIGAGNLMNNAYRAAHLKLKYGKRFDGIQDQEKTAGVGKTIYDSKSKLKDAAFGTYKKGPYKGDNKFNVAYGKRAVKKHYEKLFDMHTDLGEQQRNPKNATWNINGYNKSFDKKTKVGQANRSSIKHDYDDAFVEAAARPVALTALGLGVGIYGGKKLLDRYKKRQEEKKEQSYYV